MDFGESLVPETVDFEQENNIENKKTYNLKLKDDLYILEMEINSNEKIIFKVKQKNKINDYFYLRECSYEEIIKKLLLTKEYYDNIYKVFDFYDKSLIKNKVYEQRINIIIY